MNAPPLKLSVMIPVYNERANIEELLLRVRAVDIEKETILVEGNSTDGTREFLQDLTEGTTSNPGAETLPGRDTSSAPTTSPES